MRKPPCASGLVEQVVDSGEARGAALLLAAKVARQSPVAIRTIKLLIQGARERAPNTWLRRAQRFVDLFDAQDTREGVNAFLESAIPSGATAELFPSNPAGCASPPEPSPDMNVLFEERPSLHGFRIGIATPGCGKSLNALSLPMIEGPWRRNRRLGRGRRHRLRAVARQRRQGLCAGGDVRKLVDACREQPGEVPALARRFFADEYRLDYRIHTYPKPFICWAHGYVMGGGMGLMQGCRDSHRHPVQPPGDAGDRHRPVPRRRRQLVLARLLRQARPVLGLSAAQMNARDALDPRPGRPLPSRRPAGRPARRPGADELERVAPSATSQPASRPRTRGPRRTAGGRCSRAGRAWTHCSTSRTGERLAGAGALRDDADPLLARGAKTLAEGCPMTAHLVWQQIERARYLSLAEVFRLNTP